MANEGKKKVYSRHAPKYTTSDDKGSSSEKNDDLSFLFANLTIEQKEKINELIKTINEKDEILECEEDLLVKENKKNIKLKDAFALEVEKCKNLTKELNTCNDSIFCLKTENISLIAKIEELNACKVPTSTIKHVTICTRCRYIDVNAMNDNLAMIKEQNDHIAKLNAKIAEHELENENFKFGRCMLYNGRHPDIKDGVGFQPGGQNNIKLNAHKIKISNFVKGKVPMVQDREGYILYPENYPGHKIRKIHAKKSHFIAHHAYIYSNEASSSRHQLILRCLRKRLLMHQMNIAFHLKPLMCPLFLLTNPAK
jgi:hypothetical protein